MNSFLLTTIFKLSNLTFYAVKYQIDNQCEKSEIPKRNSNVTKLITNSNVSFYKIGCIAALENLDGILDLKPKIKV